MTPFRTLSPVPALLAALCFVLPVAAQKNEKEFVPQSGQAGKDVIWVPTPDEVVEKMLDLAQVQAGDRTIDLGSGDGKIVIASAKRGAKAKGIEYNPDMVTLSKRLAQQAKVDVELVQGDIFVSDFSNNDVVTLFLLPHLNVKLRPTLLAMKPGTRVVSHAFNMEDWEPDETANVSGRDVHFWRVPANIEGTWRFRVGNNEGPVIRIRQQFQKIEGEATWGTRASPLAEASVKGARVQFAINDPWGNLHRFEGYADHRGPIVGVAAPFTGGGAQRLFVGTRQ